MNKEIMFCDCCGKQMTVFDSDGDAINVGIKIEKFTVRETSKHSCGSSYTPILDQHRTDFCSYECLTKELKPLLIKLGEQS